MSTKRMAAVIRKMHRDIHDREIGATTAIYYILRTKGADFFEQVAKRLEAQAAKVSDL